MPTTGIHHVTAIASDPQRNVNFYTGVLGLRLVKRTVNFDDPGTYHLYYGDEGGSPGSILTFFPWAGAARGVQGAGAVIATAFAVPKGSLEAWAAMLRVKGVTMGKEGIVTRFGERVLALEDHDGMRLELVETDWASRMPTFKAGGIGPEAAIRGFHSVTLCVRDAERSAPMLTEVLGYRRIGEEGARTRFRAGDEPAGDGVPLGAMLDLLASADAPGTRLGAGVVHHVAIRARDGVQQASFAGALERAGFSPTEVRDRTYFRSIYYRERSGVLFEIATDAPGFGVDEPAESLGSALKLPAFVERRRAQLEQSLEPLHVPSPGEPDLAIHQHRFEAEADAKDRPTLILLHGTGGDERDLLPLGRTLSPEANLLSPRGNVLENGQPRFFKRLREGVFDLEDMAIRSEQLAQFLEAARARYRFDPARSTIVGFSNGANIAASMLLRGERGLTPIRSAILIRAMVPFTPKTLPNLGETTSPDGARVPAARVLLLSGDADPIVPTENAERLASMLRDAGAHVTHKVLSAGHSLARQDLDEAQQWLQVG
ncbi:MAG: VOC family protein [Planctomycetota bacterium]|nr:VOC family protein [Planctomycetota bacterium]